MENKNYTIKDIAKLAGVSAGTVDRVLHNREGVSAASRAKVEQVLQEIDYHPNVFAIGLAAKKRYHIYCVIPAFTQHDYWHAVAQGIDRASQELRPFNVGVKFIHYQHADNASYQAACRQLRKEQADAVLIAPNFQEGTLELTHYLEEHSIPYLFVDFNVEHTHPLSYIGQNSEVSGYMAAKILMSHYTPGSELVLFLNNQKSSPAEIQMRRRLQGFMRYLQETKVDVLIHDVVLHKDDTEVNRRLLDAFFQEHPQARFGAVLNSRVYQVADYLQERGVKMQGLVGYDLLEANVEHLKNGEVSYLIGQRPGLQGYCGVKTLCNQVVFKHVVPSMRYMPIDILMKENIDFYFEFE